MERTATRSVTFAHPFCVDNSGTQYPPGTYEVETVEELISGLSFAAYRRVGCSISLPVRRGVSAGWQVIAIDPLVLDDLLARDAAAEVDTSDGD